jgi:GTP-binding protein EngB required for normal cell division
MSNEVTNHAREVFDTGTNARQGLATYEQHTHEIAQILREIKGGAYDSKNLSLERSVSDVTNKLASERFYLTVVGQFSRGKSTLMNAILGKDYLPSGIVPTTSAITAVSYGSREKVVLRRADTNLTSEIRIAQLADFVTERINPGNRDRIEMAEVQVPVEILQRGFFLVDTPGLGSAVQENTATTLDFLPSADAIVFVTSCDAPLTATELGYLRQCSSSVRQLFVVVNKMDLVPEGERETVVGFVESRVREELGGTPVRVYPVSARDALAARIAADQEKLRSSGLLELEVEIVAYLTAHKQKDFLLQICDRAGDLLVGSDLPQRHTLLTRLKPLRDAIDPGQEARETAANRPRPVSNRPDVGGSILRVSCDVCDRVIDATLDFLRVYQYDLYVSADVQHAHAEAGGFCAMHTWQYATLASPQGICSAYPQVVFRFSEDLLDLAEGRAPRHTTGGVAGPPLPADRTCPACQRAEEAAKKAIGELADALEAERGGGPRHQRRLCLTHLEDVLLRLHDGSAAKRLLLRESEVFRRVAENLQRYALKHEGRRSDLITEEEWQAPNQALTLLAGHRNVQPRFGR